MNKIEFSAFATLALAVTAVLIPAPVLSAFAVFPYAYACMLTARLPGTEGAGFLFLMGAVSLAFGVGSIARFAT